MREPRILHETPSTAEDAYEVRLSFSGSVEVYKGDKTMPQNYQTWEATGRCPDCNEPIYWSEDKLKYRSNCTCEEFLDYEEGASYGKRFWDE